MASRCASTCCADAPARASSPPVVERESPRLLLAPRRLESLRQLDGPAWKASIENLGDCASLQSRIKELESRLKDLEKKLQK